MRLAVVGSRKWADRKLFWKHLSEYHAEYGQDLHIVSGGAPKGADHLAEEFARQRGLSITVHHALWEDERGVLNMAAGYARNTRIVEDCDRLIAFWDMSSRGTGDTLTKARWRRPYRPFFVINPLGKVFEGEEVWGGDAQRTATIKQTHKFLTVERCRAHPSTYYIFGDNLERKGTKGQAIIRGEPNAIGIATKVKPAMDDGAFFSDKHFDVNCTEIQHDFAKIPSGARVIVHIGIGAGRAQMPMRAPKTYAFLCELLGMDNTFA